MKQVEQTNNYDLFKKLKGNRPISELRVKKIISSINNVGYITSPIIVNEKYEVVDGQGRLQALQELNLPVEYIVHPGIGIKECIAMNINQTNWSLPDYIDSYAQRGFDSYIKITELMNKYPEANLNTICTALFRSQSAPIVSVKDGTLTITQHQYNRAIEALDYAYEIFNCIDRNTLKGSIYTLVQALILCYEYPEVNNEKLLDIVKEYIHLANAWIDMDTCLQEIENLYNRRARSRVYIYTLFRQERARIKSLNGKSFANIRKRDELNRNFVPGDSVKHPYNIN